MNLMLVIAQLLFTQKNDLKEDKMLQKRFVNSIHMVAEAYKSIKEMAPFFEFIEQELNWEFFNSGTDIQQALQTLLEKISNKIDTIHFADVLIYVYFFS